MVLLKAFLLRIFYSFQKIQMGLFIPSFRALCRSHAIKEKLYWAHPILSVCNSNRLSYENRSIPKCHTAFLFLLPFLTCFFWYVSFLPLSMSMYVLMFSVVRQLAGIMVANLKVKLKKMGDWRGSGVIKSVFSISAIHFVFHAKASLRICVLYKHGSISVPQCS